MRKLKSLVSEKWLKERYVKNGNWEQRRHYIDQHGIWHEFRNGKDTIFINAEVKLRQSVWTLWFEETKQWVDTMENIYGYNSTGTSIVAYEERENYPDGGKWRYSEVVSIEKGKKHGVRIIGTYTNADGTRNEGKCIYDQIDLPIKPMTGGN